LTENAIIVTKPIHREHWESRDRHWQRSFAAITVEEVMAAVRQILASTDGLRERPQDQVSQ
jgi:hypothetical protein